MFRSIIDTALGFRFLVLPIAIGLVIFAAVRLPNMPADALPEFAPPFVEIQTEAPGLSASEMEDLITLTLEDLLAGRSWIQSISSKSVPSLSSLKLTFEPGTDIMHARQLVQERLALAYALPNVAKPPVMLQPLSATSRTTMIGMTSKKHSLIEMSVLARWTIQPKLLGVAGVANVAIWGQRRRQLHVQVDPEELRDKGVKLDQVIHTAGDALWVSPLSFLDASMPGTGGWIDTPNQRLAIQHILPISSPEELAKVVVQGETMRLGDIASVVEEHPQLIGDALINNQTGLLFVIEKFPWANAVDVNNGVEKALASLRLGMPGVEFNSSVFKSDTYVRTSLANVSWALLIGAVLATVVLLALIRGWRTALISIVAVPVSLAVALTVLFVYGVTINAMVLAGFVLALAVVIDDAVVDVDAIRRRLAGTDGSADITTVVRGAVMETRTSLLYALLAIVLFVLPFLFIGGVAGAFFAPLVQAYLLAIVASMVIALTLTPVLSCLLLGGERDSGAGHSLQAMQGYRELLDSTLRRPSSAYAIAAALALLGAVSLPFLGQSLLPQFKERTIVIDFEAAPGTSHPAMTRLMQRASNEVRKITGVRNVTSHIGRAETGDQVVNVNSGAMWVNIDPEADYDKVMTALRATVSGYSGVDGEVHTYLRETVGEALSGAGDAIVVRIYGPELDGLREQAERVRGSLQDIDGLVDLRIDGFVMEPRIQVRVDIEAASKVGLKPGDVRRATSTVFAGLEVGSLFEQQKVFDVVVWSKPDVRQSVSDVENLIIDTPDGSHVRIKDIAEVKVIPAPNVISRDGTSRYIDVVANVRGRDVASVASAVNERLTEVAFPIEYYPEVRGEFVELLAARDRMLTSFLVGLVGILLLLQAAFQSWRLAGAFLVTSLIALAGGVIAVLVTGGNIKLGSIIGFLAIFAIAIRSGILTIRHWQKLEDETGATFGPALVASGASERLPAVLAATLATAAVLLPLALSGEIAGLEIVQPMAIVILGGLIASTLINLLVLPVVYLGLGAREGEREPDLLNVGSEQNA